MTFLSRLCCCGPKPIKAQDCELVRTSPITPELRAKADQEKNKADQIFKDMKRAQGGI